MFTKKFSLILSFIVFSFVIWGFSREDDKSFLSRPASIKGSDFTLVIQDILAGRKIEESKTFISPEAYLIYGDKFEHLYSVVSGSNKVVSLKEESSRKPGFCWINMNNAQTSAIMLLKTVSANNDKAFYHTIAVTRDEGADWKIVNWHTSK